MAQLGQRKCLFCVELFFPEPRSAGRQLYCSEPACQRASHAASQSAWLAKPGNAQYFCGPVHVQRVQAWRVAHPGYGLNRTHRRRALQDALTPQVPDSIEEMPVHAGPPQRATGLALQDLLNPSTAVLAGLIAHLFEVSLQDDMANTTLRLVQRGQDLIRGGGGGDEDQQTRAAARAVAPSARAGLYAVSCGT